jgi:hypothetical protein
MGGGWGGSALIGVVGWGGGCVAAAVSITVAKFFALTCPFASGFSSDPVTVP